MREKCKFRRAFQFIIIHPKVKSPDFTDLHAQLTTCVILERVRIRNISAASHPVKIQRRVSPLHSLGKHSPPAQRNTQKSGFHSNLIRFVFNAEHHDQVYFNPYFTKDFKFLI